MIPQEQDNCENFLSKLPHIKKMHSIISYIFWSAYSLCYGVHVLYAFKTRLAAKKTDDQQLALNMKSPSYTDYKCHI